LNTVFTFSKGLVLLTLFLLLANTKLYSQSEIYFLSSDNLFQPFQASVFESKIGISSNTNDDNLKLDIGAAVDILGLRNKNFSASFGAEFFTFSNLRSEPNFKFPVDAIDYYFGVSFNYKKVLNPISTISTRFRIAHISSHFEDGHKYSRSDTIFTPVVYSREFIELSGIYDYKIRQFFTVRTLIGVNYLMHSIPDDFGMLSFQIGNELRYSFSNIFGVYLSNELRYANVKDNGIFNESLETGINLGGFDNRGINIFFSIYNGQDYKGQYYDKSLNIKSIGTHIIF